jgi:hypothetical protein
LAKLHELLAVEASRKEGFQEALDRAKGLFDSPGRFHSFVRTYHPRAEDEEDSVVERQAMETTVSRELDIIGEGFQKMVDVTYQKEIANTQALGDLEIAGGNLSGLPVSFLLHLEKTLKSLRKTFNDIPTHAQGKEWEPTEDHEFSSVFHMKHPEVDERTKKVTAFEIVAPADEYHPAQVKEIVEDRVVGELVREIYSGMWRASQKAKILQRTDEMLEAVRKARMRANEMTAPKDEVASAIWDYLVS